MSRYETSRRQLCVTCGMVTVHHVTIYDDEQHEIVHCTKCDR